LRSKGLHFGEGLLDWIEVMASSRAEKKSLAWAARMARPAKVVHDDNVARRETGSPNMNPLI